jgi:anaerobic C4-dicarboxylate transporter
MLIFLDNNSFDIFYTQEAKIAYFVFAVIVFLIIYFTMMDYKRVEFDDEHLFISNYIQTIRIPLDGVRYLKLSKNPFKVSRVQLFQNGRFGKDIKFLKYPIGIEELRKHRPDLVIA